MTASTGVTLVPESVCQLRPQGVKYVRLNGQAPAATLYRDALHPYSKGLLGSFPALRGARRELAGIPGSPPDLAGMPSGCSFHPRCPRAFEPCSSAIPVLGRPDTPDGAGRSVACWLHPAGQTVG